MRTKINIAEINVLGGSSTDPRSVWYSHKGNGGPEVILGKSKCVWK